MGAICCKDEKQTNVLTEATMYKNLVNDQNDHDLTDFYDVVKVIGVGSISKISLITRKNGKENGKRPSNAKLYALKEIDMSVVETHLVKELENELQLLKALDHPNIIKVYETYQWKKRKALVLELCSGGDLYTRMPYSEKQAAKIVKECLLAIAYLHSSNVIHRDIKFENIMFETDAPDAQVKLIDFGLSKSFLRKNDVMRERVGTLYTMSPQVMQGVYTSQADLWSLGVVAFKLLSGSSPFQANSPKELISVVMKARVVFKGDIWKERSPESKNFVKSLLQLDPTVRLTATMALEHKWIAKQAQLSDSKPTPETLTNVANCLVTYASDSFLKKIAMNVIAKRSSTDEILELRKVFEAYDTHMDGTISLEELKEALSKTATYDAQEIKIIFSNIDVNHNGVIMYTEFLAAALEAKGNIEEYRIKEAFEVFDKNHSGFISLSDLQRILGQTYSDANIAGIIKSVDIDGDGQISYAEFRKQFEKHYGSKIDEIYSSARFTTPEEPLLGLDTVIPGGIAEYRKSMHAMDGVYIRNVGITE